MKLFNDVFQDRYGVIYDVEPDAVFARIYTHEGEFDEDVSFSKSEFPVEDICQIYAGNVFYWVVGSMVVDGDVVDASEFRTRRFEQCLRGS